MSQKLPPAFLLVAVMFTVALTGCVTIMNTFPAQQAPIAATAATASPVPVQQASLATSPCCGRTANDCATHSAAYPPVTYGDPAPWYWRAPLDYRYYPWYDPQQTARPEVVNVPTPQEKSTESRRTGMGSASASTNTSRADVRRTSGRASGIGGATVPSRIDTVRRNDPATRATVDYRAGTPTIRRDDPATRATVGDQTGTPTIRRDDPATRATVGDRTGTPTIRRDDPATRATVGDRTGTPAIRRDDPATRATVDQPPGTPTIRRTDPAERTSTTSIGTPMLAPAVQRDHGARETNDAQQATAEPAPTESVRSVEADVRSEGREVRSEETSSEE